MVAQLVWDQWVGGSNPLSPTTFKETPLRRGFFVFCLPASLLTPNPFATPVAFVPECARRCSFPLLCLLRLHKPRNDAEPLWYLLPGQPVSLRLYWISGQSVESGTRRLSYRPDFFTCLWAGVFLSVGFGFAVWFFKGQGQGTFAVRKPGQPRFTIPLRGLASRAASRRRPAPGLAASHRLLRRFPRPRQFPTDRRDSTSCLSTPFAAVLAALPGNRRHLGSVPDAAQRSTARSKATSNASSGAGAGAGALRWQMLIQCYIFISSFFTPFFGINKALRFGV